MKLIVGIIYSFCIYPLLLFVFHIIGLFNHKVRKALYLRYGVIKEIKSWRSKNIKIKKTVLFHCASMGEFEHIKPLILKLQQSFSTEIVLTFFSPSGYENVKNYPGVDLIIYSPFDFHFLWKRAYKIIQPDQIIISKHDVWPNQVWTAGKMSIPVYLVNASLHLNSSRSKPAVRFFMKYVYRSLKKIYTISSNDEKRFLEFFPQCSTGLIGDTKFDQVLIRKEESMSKNLINQEWVDNSTVLIFGSIWPEDTKNILPPLKVIFQQEENVKIIFVPHQPELKYVLELVNHLKPFSSVLYSQKDSLERQRILVVDTVGVLADLYKYAHIAYVGGSFRQGIHNVMEPAIYGIPVLYGPQYKNSLEAIRLLESGGSAIVKNEAEVAGILLNLIRKKDERAKMGSKAASFALNNCGATDRLIDEWREIGREGEGEKG